MKRAAALTWKGHAGKAKDAVKAHCGAGVGTWERQPGESSDRRVPWEAPSVAVAEVDPNASLEPVSRRQLPQAQSSFSSGSDAVRRCPYRPGDG